MVATTDSPFQFIMTSDQDTLNTPTDKELSSSSGYAQRLISLQSDRTDTERGHVEADNILCELLKELGYSDVVEEFEKIDKWYS